jgi:hypothetical protein
VIFPRLTIGCMALVGFASGCSDTPDPVPRPYPVLNERGLITYTYEEPQAQPISTGDRVQVPVFEAELRPHRINAEAARLLAEHRQIKAEQRRILLEQLSEQARRERQELAAREDEAHKNELEIIIWKRQQAREAMNASADRRRASLRGWQSEDQSDQLRATSIHLSREADRLRQEARSLRPHGAGDIDDRPFPITIP